MFLKTILSSVPIKKTNQQKTPKNKKHKMTRSKLETKTDPLQTLEIYNLSS